MSKITDKVASTTNTPSDGGPNQLEVLEQRLKSAQGALTPAHQEIAKLKQELAAANSPVEASISPEKQTELDNLKFTDPDAWRTQMNTLEQANTDAVKKQVTEEMKMEQDKTATRLFLVSNPNIDVEVLRNVIPVALQEKYKNGEISIETILESGKRLLDGAPIASVLAPDSPNLGNVSGSDRPTNQAKQKQVEQDWSSTIL